MVLHFNIYSPSSEESKKPQIGSSKEVSGNIHAEYKKGYQILAVGAVPMQTLLPYY